MKKAPYIFAATVSALLVSCSAEKQALKIAQKDFAKEYALGLETGLASNTKDYYNECFTEDFARGFNDGIKANSKDYYNENFAKDFARGLNEGLKSAEEKKKPE